MPDLVKIKPDIIMFSTCQQGQTGPHAKIGAYGTQLVSLSGFTYLTGWPDRDPTGLYGPKPVNTSGGLKCKGHPVGATGVAQLYEVWKQLRGEAGERQIPNRDLKIGAAHNLGGTGGACTLVILERR